MVASNTKRKYTKNNKTRKMRRSSRKYVNVPIYYLHNDSKNKNIMGGNYNKSLRILYFPSFSTNYKINDKDNRNSVSSISMPIIQIDKTKYNNILDQMKSQFRDVDDFMAFVVDPNQKIPKHIFEEQINLKDDSMEKYIKDYNTKRRTYILNEKLDNSSELRWPGYLPQKTEEEKIDEQIAALERAKSLISEPTSS